MSYRSCSRGAMLGANSYGYYAAVVPAITAILPQLYRASWRQGVGGMLSNSGSLKPLFWNISTRSRQCV